MKNEKRTDYITRDSLLKLLSDDEVASVSTAEVSVRLSDGEEYLDLEHLEKGVQRADVTTSPMKHLITRKAVQEKTWEKILAQLKRNDNKTVSKGA